MKITDINIYRLPSTELAPYLLGKILCIKQNQIIRRARITETEAYFGEEDTACHAHKGRTNRTEVLYHEGGISYVYLCYGIHALINIISGESEHPQGVLIRGIEGFDGPGKLTKHLGIDISYNKLSLIDSDVIWIEDDGFTPDEILTSPRIGINYATPEYIEKPWRYYYKY